MSELTPTHRLIAERIAAEGPLPFDTVMETALYHPEHGYYENPNLAIGRQGDFMTSVSVGPVFGALLAFGFRLRLAHSGGDTIVEAGAHDGQLARDILDHWPPNERPKGFRYRIVEPSPVRRRRQETQLDEHAGVIEWVKDLGDIADGSVRGVVFGNELLDAFPVRVLQWNTDAKVWFERCVGLEGGTEQFTWETRTGAAASKLPERFALPDAMAEVLPEGFLSEHSPSAIAWWAAAARKLETGSLLAIDYGWRDHGWLEPGRAHGTLRAYYRHQLTDAVLDNLGEQDLTTHVAFPDIVAAGERAGLGETALQTQSQFLTSVARSWWEGPETGAWRSGWNRGFHTLIDPNQFGHRFLVLDQSKT